MSKKKVLIITYYWPPSGGGGVQRWLKFVKYLPEFGWEPIVFTPENPEFDLKDNSLLKDVNPNLEVIKFPIWEPFSFYKKIFKKKDKLKQGIVIEKSKMTLVDKFSIWVRANLFIPDPRRFWIKPSVDFLVPFIKEQAIDVVITTGPPHSMHLIGHSIKKKCDIKWVADFRDPWSEWDVLDKLNVSGFVRRIHKNLEKKVIDNADLTLTVSNRLAQSLASKVDNSKVEVITNGVDHTDLELGNQDVPGSKFRISHMGLLNEVRDPNTLWTVLEELCREEYSFQQDLEIVLAGMVSESILDRLKNSAELASCLNHLDYISHKEVFSYYKSSSVLLLLLNQSENAKWILPGKLFEYLLADKPILTLGEEESDVRDILLEANAGDVFAFDDSNKIKTMILQSYYAYKNGSLNSNSKNTDQFLRKNLTEKLAKLLNTLA